MRVVTTRPGSKICTTSIDSLTNRYKDNTCHYFQSSLRLSWNKCINTCQCKKLLSTSFFHAILAKVTKLTISVTSPSRQSTWSPTNLVTLLAQLQHVTLLQQNLKVAGGTSNLWGGKLPIAILLASPAPPTEVPAPCALLF